MDLIEEIANDPAVHLEMDFQPGDIQLLNNACILHAREAYTDHDFAAVEDVLREGIPTRRA